MQKECEICGGFFETPTKTRKYCDDCLAHQKRNMGDVYFAQKRARSYMPDKVNDYVCHTCGTEFKATARLVHRVSAGANRGDGHDRYFCSNKCEDEFKSKHTHCRNCGKLIKDTKNITDDWRSWYCDDNCREEERWKIARKEGRVHKCIRCGKEFIRKDGGFCSKECYRAAVDDGWQPNSKDDKPKTVDRYEKCPVCGRVWIKTYPLPLPEPLPVVCCSEKCDEIYARKVKEAQAKSRKRAIEETRKMAKKKPKEHLCATCKVPYADCERMKSEFRVLPEGARYNEDGILTICPKYRNTKDKASGKKDPAKKDGPARKAMNDREEKDMAIPKTNKEETREETKKNPIYEIPENSDKAIKYLKDWVKDEVDKGDFEKVQKLMSIMKELTELAK